MKKKSFIYQTWWIGLIPLLIGFIFMVVAVVMQLVPMTGVEINGVYTESVSAVRNFRLIFIGLYLIGYPYYQNNKNQRLIEQGTKITAKFVDFQATALNVNNSRLSRLTCTGKINGVDYIFKSQPLRRNPVPFLRDDLIDVYYSVKDVVEL